MGIRLTLDCLVRAKTRIISESALLRDFPATTIIRRMANIFPYRKIAPNKTMLLFDVTGTVLGLDRKSNTLSLSKSMQSQIIRYAQMGARICFISGDPLSVLKSSFFDALSYNGSNPIYVATELGHEIYKLVNGKSQLVCQGAGFSIEEKEQISTILTEAFIQVLGCTIDFKLRAEKMEGKWENLAPILPSGFNDQRLAVTFTASAPTI